MTARLADIAAQAEVSEATVSRVLNGRPGVAERPARPCSPRSTCSATSGRPGCEREVGGARRPGDAGAGQPDLPGVRRRSSRPRWPRHGFTPVLCTQTPGGVHEDEYVEMLLERGVSGIIFVSGLHADASADPGRYQGLARARPADGARQRLAGRRSTRRSSRTTTWRRWTSPSTTSSQLGHSRIGLAVGPGAVHPGASARSPGFRRGRCARSSGVSRTQAGPLVSTRVFAVEGGQAAAAAAARRAGAPRSSAGRT